MLDDTSALFANNDCIFLKKVLQSDIARLKEWFGANKLALNESKKAHSEKIEEIWKIKNFTRNECFE